MSGHGDGAVPGRFAPDRGLGAVLNAISDAELR